MTSESAAVPAWVDGWQDLLQRSIAAEAALRGVLKEADSCLGEYSRLESKVLSGTSCEDGEHVAAEMLARMIRRAEAQNAIAGGAISIDPAALMRALELAPDPGDERRYVAPSDVIAEALVSGDCVLAAVWAALGRLAQGEDTQAAALRATARQIEQAFYRSLDGRPIRRVRGRYVLELSVYTEKPYSGTGLKLSYRCYDGLRNACAALDAVLERAGLPAHACRLIWGSFDYHRAFQSRDRFVAPGITVVAFSSKLEFHLDEPVAMEVSRFLAEFGRKSEAVA